MSFVIIRGERIALELGQTILGGRGEGALPSEAAADLRPSAVIDYPLQGPSTVTCIGAENVTLNGSPLKPGPNVLRHGDRIEVEGLIIAFGEMQAAGRTSNAAPVPEDAHALDFGQPTPTDTTGGRLTRIADGAVHEIPAAGLTLGRDPDSDVVLASRDASRRHASITATLLGYSITDQSSNGVWINGVRLESIRILSQGDVIRIADEDFRFEADEASFAPAFAVADEAPRAAAAVPLPRPAPAPRLLASLEVLSEGEWKAKRFRIEQPTVQVGRGPHNDITLSNDSVSGRHASLVLRNDTWYITDLESRNGTYVQGEIVRGERRLPEVCELRFGVLDLMFRAINSVAAADSGNALEALPPSEMNGTIRVIGVTDGQIDKG